MASTAPPRFPQLPDPSAREGKLKIFIPDGVVVHTILACMYRKEEKKREKVPGDPALHVCVFISVLAALLFSLVEHTISQDPGNLGLRSRRLRKACCFGKLD